MDEPSLTIRARRSIPRQTLGGLSLLLVVALTFGAARSGTLVHGTRDSGFERVSAVLPRVVQNAERRLQRERPDLRASSRPARLIDRGPGPVIGAGPPVRSAPVPLREALLDLPPPARA